MSRRQIAASVIDWRRAAGGRRLKRRAACFLSDRAPGCALADTSRAAQEAKVKSDVKARRAKSETPSELRRASELRLGSHFARRELGGEGGVSSGTRCAPRARAARAPDEFPTRSRTRR